MREDFPLPDLTWEPTRPYWEAAAREELQLPRCDACGRLHWYPTPTCRHCNGEAFTWETMSGRGTLFSWVVVKRPWIPEYASLVPFVPALVSLEEDPTVRVTTRIVDVEPGDLEFDMPLQAVYRPLRFDRVEGEVIAPLFTRPT
jgi:uncharacterized OB-fold protein